MKQSYFMQPHITSNSSINSELISDTFGANGAMVLATLFKNINWLKSLHDNLAKFDSMLPVSNQVIGVLGEINNLNEAHNILRSLSSGQAAEVLSYLQKIAVFVDKYENMTNLENLLIENIKAKIIEEVKAELKL